MDSNWSDDIEKVLAAIHISCTLYAEHHKKRYFYLKGYLKYFRIPTIIISGISSVSSVGLQPYIAQSNISMLTCVLTLLCGIITSIELYLQIQASMENELVASKDFYLLAADIYKMLTLSRANRGVGGISYLDEKFGIFCKYIESSHLINNRIKDTMRFADTAVRRPPTGTERSMDCGENSVFRSQTRSYAPSCAPSRSSRASRHGRSIVQQTPARSNSIPDDTDSVSSSVTGDGPSTPNPNSSVFKTIMQHIPNIDTVYKLGGKLGEKLGGKLDGKLDDTKSKSRKNKAGGILPLHYNQPPNTKQIHRTSSAASMSSKTNSSTEARVKQTRLRTVLEPTDTCIVSGEMVKMPDFPGSSRTAVPHIACFNSQDAVHELQKPHNEQQVHSILEMVTRTHLSEAISPEITIGHSLCEPINQFGIERVSGLVIDIDNDEECKYDDDDDIVDDDIVDDDIVDDDAVVNDVV